MIKTIQECMAGDGLYWLHPEDKATEVLGYCNVVVRGLLPPTKEIQVGSRWRHVNNGHTYTVLGVVTREHDLELCVVYQGEPQITLGGVYEGVWCRPLPEFTDGRFELVG